jgi:hypothetical protein
VTALTFYNGSFKDAIADLLISKDSFAKLEKKLQIDKGSIVYGFCALIEHTANFGFFFEHLASNKRIELQDRMLFQRRVKQLCGWRLGFGTGQTRQTLLDLAANAGGCLPPELISHINPYDLGRELKMLLNGWSADSSYSDITASSGA